MSKFKSDPLDSCEKNLVNTKSSQTIGDYLCQQVTDLLTTFISRRILYKEDIKEGETVLSTKLYNFLLAHSILLVEYCLLCACVDQAAKGC